jgi:hypothetical protein
MRKFLVIAGLIAFSLPAMAQDTPTRVTPDALAWRTPCVYRKLKSDHSGDAVRPRWRANL